VQQLSVTIRRTSAGVQFDPATLNAYTGDQIFWVNDDKVSHQPAAVNPDNTTTPIVNPIKPGDTSNIFSPSPAFDSAGNPISYTIRYTSNGAAAQGAIAVTPNP
jgi:plastocyanin